MAVDFEALDLVRSSNRSRSYNKKLDDLARENQELAQLASDAIEMCEELEKGDTTKYSNILKDKLKKIKKGG
tara:strand:+ start:184 stop:399 length:216 start_codon:yes stop_codon:yes gene_type:complete